jgi:hypothetical protein
MARAHGARTHPRRHIGRRPAAGTATLLAIGLAVAIGAVAVVRTMWTDEDATSRDSAVAGASTAGGEAELTGGVVAVSDGSRVTAIVFSVSAAPGGPAVEWDYEGGPARVVVGYTSQGERLDDLPYLVTIVAGDADRALEPGELFEVAVAIPEGVEITDSQRFRLDAISAGEVVLILERTTPPALAPGLDDLN